MSVKKDRHAEFRFYEELNDFLESERRKRSFTYHFSGRPAIKDSIEAIGVPHTEVDLILVNGESVAFDYQLQHDDRVSVYPVFEGLDISPITHLRAKPLRDIKFVLDVHLGKLAKDLRMLGFDTLYENNYSDEQIITLSLKQSRIILTRDIGLLKDGRVTHGYWIRHTNHEAQVREVVKRFDLLSSIEPFQRCLECNGQLRSVTKESVLDELPPRTKDYYDDFYRCSGCKRIYWEGSHYQNMQEKLKRLIP